MRLVKCEKERNWYSHFEEESEEKEKYNEESYKEKEYYMNLGEDKSKTDIKGSL